MKKNCSIWLFRHFKITKRQGCGCWRGQRHNRLTSVFEQNIWHVHQAGKNGISFHPCFKLLNEGLKAWQRSTALSVAGRVLTIIQQKDDIVSQQVPECVLALGFKASSQQNMANNIQNHTAVVLLYDSTTSCEVLQLHSVSYSCENSIRHRLCGMEPWDWCAAWGCWTCDEGARWSIKLDADAWTDPLCNELAHHYNHL